MIDIAKRGPKARTEKLIKNCKFCGKEFEGKPGSKYCSRKCATAWRKLYGHYYIPNPNGKRKDTLYWDCKKSTGGDDCPWANEFIPVEGWNASETEVTVSTTKDYKKKEASYIVRECPLFKRG